MHGWTCSRCQRQQHSFQQCTCPCDATNYHSKLLMTNKQNCQPMLLYVDFDTRRGSFCTDSVDPVQEMSSELHTADGPRINNLHTQSSISTKSWEDPIQTPKLSTSTTMCYDCINPLNLICKFLYQAHRCMLAAIPHHTSTGLHQS